MSMLYVFAKSSLDKLEQERAALEAEVAALKRPWGTFAAFEPLNYGATKGDPLNDYDWPRFEAAILEARAADSRNVAIQAENDRLMKRLVDTIAATGIRRESSKWNGRKRTYESVTAEWADLLRATLKVRPSLSFCEDQHAKNIKRRQEAKAAAEKSARDAERKRAQEESDRRKVAVLVDVARALGLPVTSDTDDIRQEIRRRDKYIDLASAGLAARNNWNDGPGEVCDALSRFADESIVDKEISAEWQAIVDDFEDGRSFRDCEWNYGKLLGLADPSLVAIWNQLEAVS